MLKETFFNQIINNFLEHVFVLNGKEEIVFQTENNGSLLGYSNAEISDHGFQWLFISSHFLLTDAMEKAKKYGEYYCTENFKHKTKEYINIAFRILCYEDQEKKETLYTIYLKDNTQQNIVRKDIIKKSLTIENLSKSRKIRDGRIKEAVHELLESSSRAMNCTRVNAWVLDNEKSEIQCIGNFDASVNTLVAQSALPRIALPLYFKLFG